MKGSFFNFTKISWKLTILYASIFALVLLLLSASVLYGIRYFLVNQAEQKIGNIIDTIEEKVKGSAYEQMTLDDPELLSDNNSDSAINIRIANANGNVVNSTNNSDWSRIPLTIAPDTAINLETEDLHLLVENRILPANGEARATIQVAMNLGKEHMFLKALFFIMAGADLIGIVISLLAGYLVSRRMLYPIDRITRTAQNISAEKLNQRITVNQTNDELSRLAATFNEMIDRLQTAFEKQNQFVSDASHELRTPISVVQGYIGLIDRWGKEDKIVLQESIDAIKNETAGMSELIERLLFLARGDSCNQKLQKSEFSLNGLISEVSRESKLISEAHYVQFRITEEILLIADRKMLKQMLRALIDNSIKFTPAAGRICISAGKNKNAVGIAIKDTGIGIPQEEINHIFNRFYRVDKARSKETGGSGLGLSIVKWIVDAHNGSITADSTLGEGTCISIMLPQ